MAGGFAPGAGRHNSAPQLCRSRCVPCHLPGDASLRGADRRALRPAPDRGAGSGSPVRGVRGISLSASVRRCAVPRPGSLADRGSGGGSRRRTGPCVRVRRAGHGSRRCGRRRQWRRAEHRQRLPAQRQLRTGGAGHTRVRPRVRGCHSEALPRCGTAAPCRANMLADTRLRRCAAAQRPVSVRYFMYMTQGGASVGPRVPVRHAGGGRTTWGSA